MTTPHLPVGRVPVPIEVQMLLGELISAGGKARARVALGVGEHTLEDAIAPGATLIPKTLVRIVEKLHAVSSNTGATP